MTDEEELPDDCPNPRCILDKGHPEQCRPPDDQGNPVWAEGIH